MPAGAGTLGVIHRDVGVAQERLGVVAARGDADAYADEQLAPVNLEAPLDDVDDALGDDGGVGGAGQQDRELVAADPRAHIVVADASTEPLGDGLQQLVAHGVAERIVDDLKPVEIEEQHRHLVAAAVGPHEFMLEAVEQQRPVTESGERVGECLGDGVVVGSHDREDHAHVVRVIHRHLLIRLGEPPFGPGGPDRDRPNEPPSLADRYSEARRECGRGELRADVRGHDVVCDRRAPGRHHPPAEAFGERRAPAPAFVRDHVTVDGHRHRPRWVAAVDEPQRARIRVQQAYRAIENRLVGDLRRSPSGDQVVDAEECFDEGGVGAARGLI